MHQLEEHTDASARGAHSGISSRSTQLHQLEEHTEASARGAHSCISSRSTQWHQLEEHTARGAPEQGSEAPTPLPLASTVIGDSSLEDQLTGTKPAEHPEQHRRLCHLASTVMGVTVSEAPTPLPIAQNGVTIGKLSHW